VRIVTAGRAWCEEGGFIFSQWPDGAWGYGLLRVEGAYVMLALFLPDAAGDGLPDATWILGEEMCELAMYLWERAPTTSTGRAGHRLWRLSPEAERYLVARLVLKKLGEGGEAT